MEQEKAKSDIIDFLTDNDNCMVVLVGLFAFYNGLTGIRMGWVIGFSNSFTPIILALAIFYLVIGVFLMRFKNRARISAMTLSGLYFVLVAGTILILAGKETSLLERNPFVDKFQSLFNVKYLVNVVCHAAVLVILTRKKVRERFS